ncbi:MAG TPA: triple tyrosine motif-containing protein [Panacibacter sp.]|nr:triple tyrosine motif-containing protein [Panacibacter sp.]
MLRILSAFTLCIFSGKMIYSSAQSSLPVITACKVSGKDMPLSSVIELHAENNSFSFEYALPGTVSTAYYAYMLEGFDRNWIAAGSRTFVNYTNMSGGSYAFRVKASIDSVHWVLADHPVLIHINTPFFNSAWFVVLIAFTILSTAGLIVYFAHYTQLQRMLMTQKIRNNIASDLHDDIGSSLSSIMLMSEFAKRRPGEANNYFDEIRDSAGKIIENMNDIVWAINPKNDSMTEIMMRMQNFASALLEQKNISLQFEAGSEINSLKLSMEERKNFYLIFKEAIHNAFKYAGCSKVKVNIKSADKNITMQIDDNGNGFDVLKNYTGNGLYNMQKRAEEINGTLIINSSCGQNTSVLLSFKTTQTGS